MSDREDKAVAVLIAAKDAYRKDRSEKNLAAKDKATVKLQAIRQEERSNRPSTMVVADTMIVTED